MTKGQPRGIRVGLQQRSRDGVADGPSLPLISAALDLDQGVVATLRAGDPEGHHDLTQVHRVAEVVLDGAAVDHDLTIARHEADPRDARLAPPGAIEEGIRDHRTNAPVSGNGSGRCASCGWSAPA